MYRFKFKEFDIYRAIIVFGILFNCLCIHAQQLPCSRFHTHRGNLKNSFLKFQNQKKGRVVFLGGSITWGSGWRDSVCNYLKNNFPETEFDFINAGIPSMGSTPGAFRFTKDVLKNGQVDLLFEEAAVNDDTNGTKAEEIIRGMEGIFRHALWDNPQCDIVLMHFADPGKIREYNSGQIPAVIALHEKVASYYEIPSVNLAKEVAERISNHEFSWEHDFKDLHPSPFGHGIYAHSIIDFLMSAWKTDNCKNVPENHIIPEPLDRFSYFGGVLIEPNPPKPARGWEMCPNWIPVDGKGTRDNFVKVPMLSGTYPGEIIKFHFKGNAVGIAVAAGPDAGSIEYSIDGQPWQTQDLFTQWSKNLHLPWFYTLGSCLKGKNHVLQLRLKAEKNPESAGNVCRIRYFYVNDPYLQSK